MIFCKNPSSRTTLARWRASQVGGSKEKVTLFCYFFSRLSHFCFVCWKKNTMEYQEFARIDYILKSTIVTPFNF